MKIDILTLFPEMFQGPFNNSIIKRAQEKDLVEIKLHNLRNWSTDKHKSVDNHPYGGGTGMLLRVDIVDKAIASIKSETKKPKGKIKTILLDAGGEKYNQKKAQDLSKVDNLILVCGHYEGVDARVHEHLVDEVISIGDYVLTGGEIPAMVIIDSIIRLIPGVLEKKEATIKESFTKGLLEYPQYTRPEDFKGWKVPKVLLSGNHKEIEKWKNQKAMEKTKAKRPDLLAKNET